MENEWLQRLDGYNKFGKFVVNSVSLRKHKAMTTEQIELLFKSALEEKAIYNELTGISEDKIYNWRKGRGAQPSIGDMLNVLYQLKKISITENS